MRPTSRLISLENEYEDELSKIRTDRHSKTLFETDRLRLILITMNAGATLRRHSAPGPISIQPVSGRFTVAVEDGASHTLRRNEIVVIEQGVMHSVAAGEDGAFLLSIAWPPDPQPATLELDPTIIALQS